MHRLSWIVLILTIVSAGTSRAKQVQSESYATWIAPYQTGPLNASFGATPGQVRLVITAIEGDGKASGNSVDRSGFLAKYGCSVSTDGRISYFSITGMGVKGGGYPTMSAADQRRLDELLGGLPDDFSHLPPPDRRLVLQVVTKNGVNARVYDRANAPDSILEILRLTQSGIRSWVLTFTANDQWTSGSIGSFGALAISPDRTQVISSDSSGPLRVWDPLSHARLREIRDEYSFVTGLSFSPDGSLAILERLGVFNVLDGLSLQSLREISEPFVGRSRHSLSDPLFTPDGRYLLVQSDEPALLIFDTKNWQRVSSLAGMPQGALALFSSLTQQRSVYITSRGSLALWDSRAERNVATLDDNGRVLWLAFSPDESLVAIATLHGATPRFEGTYRIRVWNTENGSLVRELLPFERKIFGVEGVFWSSDEKYVLAVTKSENFYTSRGIGIWNIQTGRHRGELEGCITNVTGVGVLKDGRLVEGCADGVIRVWEMGSVMARVRAFDESLTSR